ncbi:hypothetical protein JCM8547_004482 [Rhodosporidiobolus lusitaniae]
MSCLATPLRFLRVSPVELNLATSLFSGQSFRWARFSPPTVTLPDASSSTASAPPGDAEEFAFGWQDRTVVLRQDARGIYYRSLYPFLPPHTAFTADLERDTTLEWLRRYFQLDVPLAPLYEVWSKQDARFRKKVEAQGETLRGIRVLAQDEWETLVSFICSANNNISRITLMVNRLCASRGSPLPHPSHFSPSSGHSSASSIPDTAPPPLSADDLSFFSFPPPSALTAPSTEPLLRQLGFGYRASYIPSTASLLLSLSSTASPPVTPEAYLRSLRRDEFTAVNQGGISDAREKLLVFKGVGRKVADCVLLFGLGWSETVPVDTHVFQIAIRDYSFPSSRQTSLTPALHDRVASHLSSRWGAHAGWTQQVLFLAKINETGSSSPSKKKGGEVWSKIELEEEQEGVEGGEGGEKKRKLTFEEEVAALIADPSAKRSRRTRRVVKTSVKVEVEVEEVVKGEEEDGDSSGLSSVEDSPKPKKKAKKSSPVKGKKAAAVKAEEQ